MDTPTKPHQRRKRPRTPLSLTVIVALSMTVAACNSRSEPTLTDQSSTTAAAAATSTTTTAAPSTLPTAASSTEESVVEDPYELLNAAVALLGPAYEFQTETTIDDVEVSIAAGRRVDDATEITFEQADTTILYRSIAERQWTQLPDGQWQELGAGDIPVDPLAQINQPSDLEIIADTVGSITLRAVYDPATFSIDTGDDITATLTITDGELSDVDYQVDVSDSAARVHTSFASTSNPAPIAIPTP
jgi:hypothetical protein